MITVRPIIPKLGRMFLPAAHRRAIEQTMKQGEDAALAEISRLTRRWSSPPEVEVKRQGDIIGIIVADGRWIYNDDPGTRPHIITPRRRTFLRFRGRDGSFVFARSVRHPGTKPQYLSRQVQQKVNAVNLAGTFANLVQEFTR